MVAFLLNNGAKTDIADCLDDTPLHVATQLRIGGAVDYSKTIELLLKAGANVDSRNKIGFTPRSEILFSGREELQNLIDKYSVEKTPEPSEHEQGLAKLLVKFSSFLNVDEQQKTKLKSLLPEVSSSDSENDSIPELVSSDDEEGKIFTHS